MDVFNLLAGICSIVGLFVSCFTASKVYKMSNVEAGDNATIQNGEKNIHVDGGGNSYSAGNQSTINNYHFMEQIEKEPPILEQSKYNIIPQEYDKYKEGVDGKICNLLLIGESNNFRFISDFSDIESHPEINRWIGFAIRSLPMYDWRSFVKDDYCLEFSYIGTDNLDSMWIELTNKQLNKKVYKKCLNLSTDEKKFCLRLGEYKNRIDDWESIDEICFVFFPEECIGYKGTAIIMDLVIKKDK